MLMLTKIFLTETDHQFRRFHIEWVGNGKD